MRTMITDQTGGKQYHIDCAAGDVGKYVILPGDPGRCEKIARYFDEAIKVADHREYVTYTGFLNGERVSVTSTGIGGPSAAIAMEELVKIGAHTFIRVGTSGGMNENVLPGDVVVATGAIRMEGTSREYMPIEFPAVADYHVVTALAEAAEKLKFRHHIGVVQCKDSFYGQHSPEKQPVSYELLSKWKAWIAGGALASEMESALLFVLGGVLNVRVGSIMLAIANQERRKMGLKDDPVYDTSTPIKIAIAALKTLIDRDKQPMSQYRIVKEEIR